MARKIFENDGRWGVKNGNVKKDKRWRCHKASIASAAAHLSPVILEIVASDIAFSNSANHSQRLSGTQALASHFIKVIIIRQRSC
ncbi:MAG: hypothetical protein QM529_06835, partial [Hydrotalea sp.]|nr:hypothetical protein [Hydrotalea sp.]